MNTSLTPEPAVSVSTTEASAVIDAVAETATAAETAAAPAPDAATGSTPASVDAAAPVSTPAPAAAPAPAAPAQSARALLKQLQQQFPAFRDCLPLSIGIDKQIIAQIPGIDKKSMRTALGIHTGSQRYLRVMEKASVRYDLNGTAGAAVTDVHRKHAKEVLKERLKKEADRKKAERDAAAEEEAARLRQEKLAQLTAKFSKKG